MSGARLFSVLFALSSLLIGSLRAEEAAPAEDPDAAVWHEASAAMIHGPKAVQLRDQAQIQLPQGYGFVPRDQAAKVMEVMGNQTGPSFIGLIFPLAEKSWFVTVDYEDAGYIEDDEANDWDADGLLKNLREGTAQGNKEREKRGIAPIQVTRWIETPTYDAVSHQLVWSAEVRLRDGEDPDPGVNYNTYVLGREGYISMDLVTSTSTVESDKPAARDLLAAVSFNDGKRYTDFNASTDKVAAYGIAALVGGFAIKKLGLLAIIGAFVLKFAKVILIGVAALGGGLVKWWKGRTQAQD